MTQKDHDMRRSKGSRIVERKARKDSLAEDVNMVSANLNAMEIGPEKPRDSEWNRIACCGGCVRFAWCVELQVPFGSELPLPLSCLPLPLPVPGLPLLLSSVPDHPLVWLLCWSSLFFRRFLAMCP